MKLSLASLKVHLEHCAIQPSIGRKIGLLFTTTGTPAVAVCPICCR